MTSAINVQCKFCGKKYLRRNSPSDRKAKNYYCSVSCRNLGRRQLPYKQTCLICKVEFVVKGGRLKKYCSVPCYNVGKIGRVPVNKGTGITPEKHLLRLTKEYSNWRNAVFSRDKFVCQMDDCTSPNYKKQFRLEAHHIIPFAQNENLRLDVLNGITLCKPCHLKTKTKEKSFIEIFTNKICKK